MALLSFRRAGHLFRLDRRPQTAALTTEGPENERSEGYANAARRAPKRIADPREARREGSAGLQPARGPATAQLGPGQRNSCPPSALGRSVGTAPPPSPGRTSPPATRPGGALDVKDGSRSLGDPKRTVRRAGLPTLTYGTAVERPVSAGSTGLTTNATPTCPPADSRWSKQSDAARLRSQGLMTPAGEAAVEAVRRVGQTRVLGARRGSGGADHGSRKRCASSLRLGDSPPVGTAPLRSLDRDGQAGGDPRATPRGEPHVAPPRRKTGNAMNPVLTRFPHLPAAPGATTACGGEGKPLSTPHPRGAARREWMPSGFHHRLPTSE